MKPLPDYPGGPESDASGEGCLSFEAACDLLAELAKGGQFSESDAEICVRTRYPGESWQDHFFRDALQADEFLQESAASGYEVHLLRRLCGQ